MKDKKRFWSNGTIKEEICYLLKKTKNPRNSAINLNYKRKEQNNTEQWLQQRVYTYNLSKEAEECKTIDLLALDAMPTEMKYCCNYMLNFSPGPKRKFSRQNLLRCKNKINAHARASFSAQTEKNYYMNFSVRFAGLEVLAPFENTGLGVSARSELRTRLNPSPCNRQFHFKKICFRSRAEISAPDEIRHVITPLEYRI